MSSKSNSSDAPLGGIFSVIGLFVGGGYGYSLSEGDLGAALVVALIGAFLGAVVEHVVFRLIIIAMVIVGFLMRQALFDAIGVAFAQSY